MYRHFRWLQAIEKAIENVSNSKTTFLNCGVENTMDGFFNRLLVLPHFLKARYLMLSLTASRSLQKGTQ